jgi:hypothetical protein
MSMTGRGVSSVAETCQSKVEDVDFIVVTLEAEAYAKPLENMIKSWRPRRSSI